MFVFPFEAVIDHTLHIITPRCEGHMSLEKVVHHLKVQVPLACACLGGEALSNRIPYLRILGRYLKHSDLAMISLDLHGII